MKPIRFPSPVRGAKAFTLIEILTAIAITTIIVFTLVSMFSTATKALQAANRQTDIWEAARATFGILKQDIGEVTVGGETNRVNLFAANGDSQFVSSGGEPMRLQDIYLLSREGNQWIVNVFLLGPDRPSDPPVEESAVLSLYRFQTNYPVFPLAGSGVADIDRDIFAPEHPLSRARTALERRLFDLANGDEPDNTVNLMARGIVHLHLVPYDRDGRRYSEDTLPADALILVEDASPFRSSIKFSGNALPASLDLEMFVLDPDRIEEFRAQPGQIGRQAYMSRHEISIELFRTRIPVRRELLASQG
jgi:hypothetical protein